MLESGKKIAAEWILTFQTGKGRWITAQKGAHRREYSSMAMRRRAVAEWMVKTLGLAAAGALLCALPAAAQASKILSLDPGAVKDHPVRPLPNRVPDQPSLAPAYSIPVDPLGFAAPGPVYFGERFSMVSLDFLDENRLLFTFRVPGLIPRGAGDVAERDERHIRAVVVNVQTSAVVGEAVWRLHDRARYLWMLKDGHFLLRDRDTLEQGDAALRLKPMLRFPGPVLWMELDPAQQYLVSNSREPKEAEAKPGEVASPPTAAASVEADGQQQDSEGEPDWVVRILRRASGEVMLVSRVRAPVHIPINSDGYLESLRGSGQQWVGNL